MTCAILIPCYEPEEKVIDLAQELLKDDVMIIIVDDGSGCAYRPIFLQLQSLGCVVLTHPVNQGKGRALKTGLAYIRKYLPGCRAVVTADGDGQHRPEDIRRVMAAAEQEPLDSARLILGVRSFERPLTPLRSRLGNRFSSLYFRITTGQPCPDTQTGLRAIPRRLLKLSLATPGERYDYEMNFLLAASENGGLLCIPITTVYENGNASSHFDTFRDSYRIYRTPIRYAVTALLSAAADLTLFTLFIHLHLSILTAFTATVAARILSGLFNFLLNRKWAFASQRSEEGSVISQSMRYLVLFMAQMCLSGLLVTLIAWIPLNLTLLKALVDAGLSLVSYRVQHSWVFRPETGEGKGAVRA